jgi:hypothetical protein
MTHALVLQPRQRLSEHVLNDPDASIIANGKGNVGLVFSDLLNLTIRLSFRDQRCNGIMAERAADQVLFFHA